MQTPIDFKYKVIPDIIYIFTYYQEPVINNSYEEAYLEVTGMPFWCSHWNMPSNWKMLSLILHIRTCKVA